MAEPGKAQDPSQAGADWWRRTLETALGPPFTTGNCVDLLQNGEEIFPAMLESIRAARRRIEFLTFVYWTGDIAVEMVEALSERAQAGVEVLILLDGFGARPMRKELVKDLQRAGCRIRWFRALPRWQVWQDDNRTHRKILVCDGAVAFTGGVGIASEWEGSADGPEHWRDNHFRIRGPAIRGLRSAFYGDWMEETGTIADLINDTDDVSEAGDVELQVVLSQAATGWNASARLQDALIQTARDCVRIQTPYLSLTATQTEALLDARDRGVSVEIMFPGPHQDKRVSELSASKEIVALLQSGVTVWRYQPTMLHSKLITADGEVASLGTANFNGRSIFKDNEVCVNVLDRRFTAMMDDVFEADRADCEKSTLGDWKSRGPFRRLGESFSRLAGHET